MGMVGMASYGRKNGRQVQRSFNNACFEGI